MYSEHINESYEQLKQQYNSAQIEVKILQQKADILEQQRKEQTINLKQNELKLQHKFNEKAEQYTNTISGLKQHLSYQIEQRKQYELIIKHLRTQNNEYKISNKELINTNNQHIKKIESLLDINSKLRSEAYTKSNLLESNQLELTQLQSELKIYKQSHEQLQYLDINELKHQSESVKSGDTIYLFNRNTLNPTNAKSSQIPKNPVPMKPMIESCRSVPDVIIQSVNMENDHSGSNITSESSSKEVVFKNWSNTIPVGQIYSNGTVHSKTSYKEHLVTINDVQFMSPLESAHEQDFIERIKQEWDEELQAIKIKHESEITELKQQLQVATKKRNKNMDEQGNRLPHEWNDNNNNQANCTIFGWNMW